MSKLICVFCDSPVGPTHVCTKCQDYKGVMTLSEYRAYTNDDPDFEPEDEDEDYNPEDDYDGDGETDYFDPGYLEGGCGECRASFCACRGW